MASPERSWRRSSSFPLPSTRRLSQGLLLLLILGLFVANWLLVNQNRNLKAAIALLGKEPEVLKPGQQVPPFTARTTSGQRQVVTYSDRAKTVLLVFLPHCEACERSVPHWKEIITACARNNYQVLGISLDNGPNTTEFLMSHGLRLNTLVDMDAHTRDVYKFSLTPQTIVIDNSGKVQKIWPGAFRQDTKQQVEQYFGISLQDNTR